MVWGVRMTLSRRWNRFLLCSEGEGGSPSRERFPWWPEQVGEPDMAVESNVEVKCPLDFMSPSGKKADSSCMKRLFVFRSCPERCRLIASRRSWLEFTAGCHGYLRIATPAQWLSSHTWSFFPSLFIYRHWINHISSSVQSHFTSKSFMRCSLTTPLPVSIVTAHSHALNGNCKCNYKRI